MYPSRQDAEESEARSTSLFCPLPYLTRGHLSAWVSFTTKSGLTATDNSAAPRSVVHLDILALVRSLDPQHVVTPYQHLAEVARLLEVDVLDGAAELDVHVRIDGDELAAVLGFAPLEPDDDFFVDAVYEKKATLAKVLVRGEKRGPYRSCSIGRGLTGAN
jgi:hypothetical protein